MTALIVLASVLTCQGELSSPYKVQPSLTDKAIKEFDDPHLVYFNKSVKPRNELLIFLPGTNGKPGGTNLFCQTAADLGYHTVAIAYPTDIPAARVRDEKDPDAFEKFRLEIIEGRDLSTFVSVNRTNSIENRLIRLLEHLGKADSGGNWGQFLSNGKINWSKIAVSGHSQGGGHAGLIAVKHRVARAVMTGAPKDFDRSRNAPAAWYKKPATPVSGFFTLNHELDRQGCNYEQQLEICKAMGLMKLGGPVSVDKEKAPYKKSRVLVTNFDGSPKESVQAHSSVIGDRITPKDKDGKPVFRAVWEYMLTAPVGS